MEKEERDKSISFIDKSDRCLYIISVSNATFANLVETFLIHEYSVMNMQFHFSSIWHCNKSHMKNQVNSDAGTTMDGGCRNSSLI
jgi:hypothetical protein